MPAAPVTLTLDTVVSNSGWTNTSNGSALDGNSVVANLALQEIKYSLTNFSHASDEVERVEWYNVSIYAGFKMGGAKPKAVMTSELMSSGMQTLRMELSLKHEAITKFEFTLYGGGYTEAVINAMTAGFQAAAMNNVAEMYLDYFEIELEYEPKLSTINMRDLHITSGNIHVTAGNLKVY